MPTRSPQSDAPVHDADDGDGNEDASPRLRRLARMCAQHQRAAAELELIAWLRDDDAPTAAALLLAGLLCARGELNHAIDLLSARWSHHLQSDPRLIECLIAALLVEGNEDAAHDLAVRLGREHIDDPTVAAFLQLVRMSPSETHAELDEPAIDTLAADLLKHIEVIPSLVAAQKLAPRSADIAALRAALGRFIGDVEGERGKLTVCLALADLAMLAADTDDARRWAHRGLRLDPYSAPLALILSRIAGDADFGPSTTTVLTEAVKAHPRYPDLKAALIRREFAEGRIDAARHRLSQWLQREPNEPLALTLQKELAA